MVRDVFVDATFVRAVLDPHADQHELAVGLFDELVGEFVAGETRLHSHAGMLEAVGHPAATDAMQVCDVRPLRRHLLREARRVMGDHPHLGLCRDLAVALVIIRRERIDEVATFDPRFHQLGVATVPPVEAR
jgi:predicted nucleic acid-binding protein